MNPDAYQKFTRTTAIYDGAQEGSSKAVMYLAFGLGGEAGEILEKLKKHIRGGGSIDATQMGPFARQKLVKELGDICWYVARLADELGVPFSEVLEMNADKLSDRKERGVIHGEGDNR